MSSTTLPTFIDVLSTNTNFQNFNELVTLVPDFDFNGISSGCTFLIPPNNILLEYQIDVNDLDLSLPGSSSSSYFISGIADLEEGGMHEFMRRNYTINDFVLCHIIQDDVVFDSTTITEQLISTNNNPVLVTTALGTSLWISFDDDDEVIQFQSSNILMDQRDIVTENGIIHGIGQPLFPPYISDLVRYTFSAQTSWDTYEFFYLFDRNLKLKSEDIALAYNTTKITLFCPIQGFRDLIRIYDRFYSPSPIFERHAMDFLLNHIMAGSYSKQDLIDMIVEANNSNVTANITMLSGETYEIGLTTNDGSSSDDDPMIVSPYGWESRYQFGDMIGLDGYVHIIDNIITPPSGLKTIYDFIAEDPTLIEMQFAIQDVDLIDLIDRDLPLTILVPDQAAWERAEGFTLWEGSSVLKKHIFRGLFFTDMLANVTEIVSIGGDVIGVEVDENNNIIVGGANLYEGDNLAVNGIFHFIDMVIGHPLMPTSQPSISPAPTMTAYPTEPNQMTVMAIYYVIVPFGKSNGITPESISSDLIASMDLLAPVVLLEVTTISTNSTDERRKRVLAPLEVRLPTFIERLTEVECPSPEMTSQEYLCLEVLAGVTVLLDDSNDPIFSKFGNELSAAIDDFRLHDSLMEVNPDIAQGTLVYSSVDGELPPTRAPVVVTAAPSSTPSMIPSSLPPSLPGVTETPAPENQDKKGESEPNDDDNGSSAGAIVGGIIGGLLGICCCAFVFYLMKRRNDREVISDEDKNIFPDTFEDEERGNILSGGSMDDDDDDDDDEDEDEEETDSGEGSEEDDDEEETDDDDEDEEDSDDEEETDDDDEEEETDDEDSSDDDSEEDYDDEDDESSE